MILNEPGQLGLKTTETVQLLPESSIPVQLLLARENALALLPVNWKEVNDRGLSGLLLVKVMLMGDELTPSVVAGKVREVGEKERVGSRGTAAAVRGMDTWR